MKYYRGSTCILLSVELNHCQWDVLCINIHAYKIIIYNIFYLVYNYDHNKILMLILDLFSNFNYLFNFS